MPCWACLHNRLGAPEGWPEPPEKFELCFEHAAVMLSAPTEAAPFRPTPQPVFKPKSRSYSEVADAGWANPGADYG